MPIPPSSSGVPSPSAGEPGAPDPSMDDILASIRRILSDEEKAAAKEQPADDVLVLDSSMLVADPAPKPAAIPVPPAPPQETAVMSEPPAQIPEPPPLQPTAPVTIVGPAHDAAPLVAPEAAAAAASSVGALMRTLASERNAAVHRGGPTIEDLVREEMRPLLKQWLDAHLPPLVERLVRAEIERVVGRIAS